MTIWRTTISTPSIAGKPTGSILVSLKENTGRVVLFALVLGISAGIILAWEEFQRLGVYGYPAVFLASLLGNAVLFLPAPSLALVFAAGASLDPILVGLFAGAGAALGEMTGYLAGYSGQAVISHDGYFRRIKSWMEDKGLLAIFFLAAVPNPLFDVGGIIAGAMRMPAWHFLFATWLGKSLRFALLAGIGVLAAG